MTESAAAAAACATTCKYCIKGTTHPSFVSLIFDGRLTPADLMAPRGPPPGSTLWDYSRQPLQNLHCHARRRRYKIGPKTSKRMAPYVQHAIVLGPFCGGASLFVRLMKEKCRRWKQKLAGSVALANMWHLLDAKRQRGKRVRTFVADIDGHRDMMESVLEEEQNIVDKEALEQAARVLIAASA